MPQPRYKIAATAALVAVGCLLLTAGTALGGWNPRKGWNRVHLKAAPQTRTWRSAPVSTHRELIFSVIVDGHDVSAKGGAVSPCRYLLVTKKLSLEVSTDCGKSKAPTVVRYSGSTRFAFLWALGVG